MRHALLIAFILLVLASTLASAQDNAQEDRTCDSIDFLASMGEMTSDLRPNGITTGDSLIVMPYGRFHLQRRMQPMGTTVTIKIFESTLSQEQFRKLRNILDSTEVKALPPYTLPAFPLNAPWFGMFDVDITRGTEIQRAGFWVWRGGTKDTPPNTTPEEVKKVWRDSQITLRPLIQWFHDVEVLKLEPSPDAKLLNPCTAPQPKH